MGVEWQGEEEETGKQKQGGKMMLVVEKVASERKGEWKMIGDKRGRWQEKGKTYTISTCTSLKHSNFIP